MTKCSYTAGLRRFLKFNLFKGGKKPITFVINQLLVKGNTHTGHL